jgi:hypothetical protein
VSTIGPACRIARREGQTACVWSIVRRRLRGEGDGVNTRAKVAAISLLVLLGTAACSSSSKSATPASTTTATTTPSALPVNSAVAVPKVIGPISGGTPDIPMNQMLDAYKSQYGYQEQEFFIKGTATSYDERGTYGADGKWAVTPGTKAPYETRILVRTPTDPKKFNGTVVVEWFNTTSGRDADPDFGFAGAEMLREGDAYVAVTAQKVGVNGGPKLPIPGYDPKGLVDQNPARYKDLQHPGDAYSYDIFSQAAQAILHPDGPSPLGPLQPKRLIAAGESQSAARLVTYINAIAPVDNIYNGYVVHSRGDGGSALNDTPTGAVPAPAFIRNDVKVPVLMLETETDLFGLHFHDAQQPDTNRIRTWQMAGTSHADQSTLDYGISSGRQWDKTSVVPDFTQLCGSINDGPEPEIVSAGFKAMNDWVTNGTLPPTSPKITLTTDGTAIARDAQGNALGGIRTPAVDVPTETLSGENAGRSPICSLFGSRTPFTAATLQTLYPTHADYVTKVKASVAAAERAGFLLVPDGAALVSEAQAAPVPS